MIVFIAALALMSFVTFILYGADKSKAKRGAWRISEKARSMSESVTRGISVVSTTSNSRPPGAHSSSQSTVTGENSPNSACRYSPALRPSRGSSPPAHLTNHNAKSSIISSFFAAPDILFVVRKKISSDTKTGGAARN